MMTTFHNAERYHAIFYFDKSNFEWLRHAKAAADWQRGRGGDDDAAAAAAVQDHPRMAKNYC